MAAVNEAGATPMSILVVVPQSYTAHSLLPLSGVFFRGNEIRSIMALGTYIKRTKGCWVVNQ